MDSLTKLVNPEFDFEFGGKTWKLRRANLDKAIQYRNKIVELQKNGEKGEVADLKLLAFCIQIMLVDKNPGITIEYVMENAPADIDVLDCLSTLGFIHPSKVAKAREIEGALVKKLTSESSSSL